MNSPPLLRSASFTPSIPRLVAPPFLPVRPFRLAPTPGGCSMSVVSSGGMAGETSEDTFRTVRTVTISYSELTNKELDLSAKIEEGFGPNGLGILSVSDVPEFTLLRQQLLQLSPRLANLPENVKRELEDPESTTLDGVMGKRKWSLANSVRSAILGFFLLYELLVRQSHTLKGSFYANPILDMPTTDTSLFERYPAYCRPNKWPTTSLPELEGGYFLNPRYQYSDNVHNDGEVRACTIDVICRLSRNSEERIEAEIEMEPYRLRLSTYREGEMQDAVMRLSPAFKTLGKLMLDVGILLACHCDEYVSKDETECHGEALEDTLLHSRCHKGRLLYYFPRLQSECSQDSLTISSWCGWHTDHGSLTGLTCGMFTRNAVEVSSPDSAAGLYVKTRDDEIVKVIFSEDEIAYQIGETTEILSRGRLCATPHCVKAPKGEKASGVERSTFALFMQPDWEQVLRFPEEVHLHQELIPPQGTLTFGEYCEMLQDKYYHRLVT